MVNPYKASRTQPSDDTIRLTAQETHRLTIVAFAVLSIAASCFTRGLPFLTVALIAVAGLMVSFFVARHELRWFVWFGVGAVVISIFGTFFIITLRYGVANSYESSARFSAAFDALAAITIPAGAILGATCGILYGRFRGPSRTDADCTRS